MKRCVIVALFLGLAAALQAVDQTWALTDGRTVTVIKVLSQNATHVTVRSADGILQIDKRQLPEELKAQYPYDEAAAAAKLGAEEMEKARVAAAAEKQPALDKRRQLQQKSQPQSGGLTIVSMRPTARATAYVTVTNHSTGMVEVNRDMFIGVSVNGAAYPSQRFTNERGDLLTRTRIPANGTTEIGVVFDIPEGDVGDIGAVYWKQQ
jgi:hypothetical protein